MFRLRFRKLDLRIYDTTGREQKVDGTPYPEKERRSFFLCSPISTIASRTGGRNRGLAHFFIRSSVMRKRDFFPRWKTVSGYTGGLRGHKHHSPVALRMYHSCLLSTYPQQPPSHMSGLRCGFSSAYAHAPTLARRSRSERFQDQRITPCRTRRG